MNIPRATYRIQFRGEMDFAAAENILPYLEGLGVSHVYASPIFKAKAGSSHGYDVVDPALIDETLGGEEKFRALAAKAKELSLGWIQDIVPNHMAFDGENHMLMDVFERGADSTFYDFFDVYWDHPYDNLRGRVLTPFLGEFYGDCLNNKEISLGLDNKGFFIQYYDARFPLSIQSYPEILRSRGDSLTPESGKEDEDRISLLAELFENVDIKDRGSLDGAKAELGEIYTSDSGAGKILKDIIAFMNSGTQEALDELHKIISRQFFRLSFWKVGNDELNYRRFFTVNSLICLKVENMEVFESVHDGVLNLVDKGYIDGIRLDHIDGLYAPLVYLRRLRDRIPDSYIAVEKILCREEEMPAAWPVQGTTGYDFLNYLNGLFVWKPSEKEMSRIYHSLSGVRPGFEDLVADKKRLFMGKHMAGDIDNLAHKLKSVFSGRRYGSDFTMYGLRRALVEIMAYFPVYRTYISELGIGDPDKFYIDQAIESARRSQADLNKELDAIKGILLYDPEIKPDDGEKEDMRDFTKRFQQITGPLMAKGAEDTAFYIYNRLISLNEVGGSPEKFGVSLDEFHAFNMKRAKDWPFSLNATSTHDTKRGEDVRTRIDFLSEISDEWGRKVKSWQKMNRKLKTKSGIYLFPDNNDEYSIYQTIVGAFPFLEGEIDIFRERVKQYIVKAVREAKVYSSWLRPDEAYEKACTNFVDNILASSNPNPFLEDLKIFHKKVAHFGVFSSLSQVLIKLTAPGVPDIYQGTELWDLSLVDPDNRRPVDFSVRREILERIRAEDENLPLLAKDLLENKESGVVKLFLTYRALRARSNFDELFRSGDYRPLGTVGEFARNVVSFSRELNGVKCVVAAPRFLSKVSEEGKMPLGRNVWKDTVIELPEGYPAKWYDAITGRKITAGGAISAGDLFDVFPGALLVEAKPQD